MAAACASQPRTRAWRDQHVWPRARQIALTAAVWTCADCGAVDWDTDIEVHHVAPVDPLTGYGPGCAHHQANLRVLCVRCHRATHQALRAKPGTQLSLALVAA